MCFGVLHILLLSNSLRCRSIHSLQYSIPAVQHHYGNAFDDDDEGGFPIGGLNGYGQGSADGEYYNDEEDEEEVDVSCNRRKLV